MSALALPVIACALFLATAWCSAALLFPAWNTAVARRPSLARRTLLVAALPALAGVAVALAAFVPGDPHLGALLGCHCATSMPGWIHLCPAHPTTAPGVLLPSLATLLLLGPGRLGALARLAREPLGAGTGATPTVVDLPRPVALLVGWLRPSLVVDRGLWRALEPAHRAAVVAHEQAHLHRRDPLVLAALRGLGSLGPARAGHTLAGHWLRHAEREADAGAAHALDNPLVVAEALLRCARLGARTDAAVLGWTGGLEGRVEALVDRDGDIHPARSKPGASDLAALAVVAAAALLSVPWLHHHLEHLLNLSL